MYEATDRSQSRVEIYSNPWQSRRHDVQAPQKTEGDGKAPAGLFALGPAFGQAQYRGDAPHLSFFTITDDLECVDDPCSQYYNQLVRRNSIATPDWTSAEKMQEVGPVYALGIVVRHNTDPIQPGAGSAIFVHVWSAPNHGTAGCTAMSLENLQELTHWLDDDKSPCLLQLPVTDLAGWCPGAT